MTPQLAFDPWDPTIQRDPYAHYAELRDDAPCHYVPERDLWVLSRYDDVRRALRNHTSFSSAEGPSYIRDPDGFVLAGSDPPDHTRTRRALQPLFHPKRIASWRAPSAEVFTRLLEPALERGEAEWMRDVSWPYPLDMMIDLMGLPGGAEHRERYARWAASLAAYMAYTPESPELPETLELLGESLGWFEALIKERTGDGDARPDLLRETVEALDDGFHSGEDQAMIALSILTGGILDTADTIASALVLLHANPDQWRLLKEDPDLAGRALDETLRHVSTTQAVCRSTTEDYEVAGAVIPEGSRVALLIGAANRDPRQFADPDRFDVMRPETGYLTFGMGVHRCIGEPLAKMEGEVALRVFAERVARFEVVGEPALRTLWTGRGWDRLDVRLWTD